MSATGTFPILFDPDRWVRVPTEYADEQWPDAAAWAEWVADELTRDREHAAATRPAVHEEALAIAGFPAEHVGARFWFFPVDGEPDGWVDVYLQFRPSDRAAPAALAAVVQLLPPLSDTVIEPAVTELDGTAFDSAVRRMSLVPLGESVLGAGRSGLLAKGEWLAVTGDWVVLLVSADADARALTRRLGDIDRLLAGIDPAALAMLGAAEAQA